MRKYIVAISLVAFAVSLMWSISSPGYDSIVSAIVTFGAFVGCYRVNRERESSALSQKTTDKSIAIQAGRDVRVGDIRR